VNQLTGNGTKSIHIGTTSTTIHIMVSIIHLIISKRRITSISMSRHHQYHHDHHHRLAIYQPPAL